MNNKLTFLFLVFGVLNCSCQNKNTNNAEKITYEIPDSLFIFFPNENEIDKICKLSFLSENAGKMEYPYVPSEFSTTYIVSEYCFKSSWVKDSTLQSLINKSLDIFSVHNERIFLMGSERELLSFYDSVTLKKKFIENKEIIPNFHEIIKYHKDIYNSQTLSGLSNGYKILILKSGNNFVLPKEYKFNWSLLPEAIKHGYRSGVAFQDNDLCLIYWVIAW